MGVFFRDFCRCPTRPTPLRHQGTAATNNISATPTFLFFRNKVRIDQYQGADAAGLEDKIKQHLENDPGNNEDADIPKGYVSISSRGLCFCLNKLFVRVFFLAEKNEIRPRTRLCRYFFYR